MSTRSSLQYVAVGSYRAGTECAWHVYHECRDGAVHLEITLASRDVCNVTLGPTARWLATHGPLRLWRNRQARRWWTANERAIQWRMKLKGLR